MTDAQTKAYYRGSGALNGVSGYEVLVSVDESTYSPVEKILVHTSGICA